MKLSRLNSSPSNIANRSGLVFPFPKISCTEIVALEPANSETISPDTLPDMPAINSPLSSFKSSPLKSTNSFELPSSNAKFQLPYIDGFTGIVI